MLRTYVKKVDNTLRMTEINEADLVAKKSTPSKKYVTQKFN
jgi:hypothetical protein